MQSGVNPTRLGLHLNTGRTTQGALFEEIRVIFMKAEIHPKYGDSVIRCACGNEIRTRSTVKEMHVNTCSACHPFFTGKAKYIDTEGRVERFRRKYGQKQSQ